MLQRAVWQALALQDLAHVCQGGPSERWRRSAIFDDESGQCWSSVVQHCLEEVLPSSHPCRHLQMPWLWEGHTNSVIASMAGRNGRRWRRW